MSDHKPEKSQGIIAIGDIHGCYRTLNALLHALTPWPKHLLVFVGDYIDRGPQSRAVVDLLIKTAKERDCIFLRGNHEHMLLEASAGGDRYNWLRNGAATTLASYGTDIEALTIPEQHLDFFNNTSLWFETETYFFCHAGIPPTVRIDQVKAMANAAEIVLWERSHLKDPAHIWEKKLVFGHTPMQEPLIKPGMIGIDTGCVYKTNGYGKLTAIVLPDETCISIENQDEP